MRRFTAVAALLIVAIATPAAAQGLPYRLMESSPRVKSGRVEQSFTLLNTSKGQSSISGEVRCSFYRSKGVPINSGLARVPPLSPSQSFSGMASIPYSGKNRLSTRCRFIEDQ